MKILMNGHIAAIKIPRLRNAQQNNSSLQQRLVSTSLLAGILIGGTSVQLFAQEEEASLSRESIESISESTLDLEEESAFLKAADFAQGCAVQIEIFGAHNANSTANIAPGAFTGTVLTEDGFIATSNHFFRSHPASITVVLANGDRRAAKLVARDFSREIAVIKIDPASPLPVARVSEPKSWQVGQWTIALGKSFDPLTASRSVGILSATERVWDKAIQTDCKISPQNYGGPLIDIYGNTMGVLTTLNPGIVTEGEVEQWYDSGIGFAIPLTDIIDRLPTLKLGTDIQQGHAGFAIRNKDEFLPGLFVSGVSPASPAFQAGLKAGDEIIRAGKSIESLTDVETHANLKHVMGPLDAGQPLVLEVQRDGARSQIEMSLVKDLPKYQEPYLGIVVVKQPDGSEKILQTADGGPAAKAGLKIGDRILSLGDQELSQDISLSSLLPFRDFREPLSLKITNSSSGETTLNVQPTARPNEDVKMDVVHLLDPDSDSKTEDEASKESIPRGIVQIPLGDIKNKSFAIVPNDYKKTIQYGLLVVYAEAGDHETKLWGEVWEKFCSENRWICVVIQSADEARWTFEEVEVGQRVRSYLSSNYSIDERRTCIAGFGSGGLMALVTSAQYASDFQALWLADTKISNRLRLTPATPDDNRRCFLNGSDSSVEKMAKLFEEAGYNFNYSPDDLGSFLKPDSATLQDKPVLERAKRWLRHLEAI